MSTFEIITVAKLVKLDFLIVLLRLGILYSITVNFVSKLFFLIK